MALPQVGGGHIGPLGVPGPGKGVEAPAQDRLLHGAGPTHHAVRLDGLDPPLDLCDQGGAGDVGQVADDDVGLGTGPRPEHLEAELGVPHPPPDQGGVDDQGLGEAILRPPGDPFQGGLIHRPGRVGPAVDDDGGGHAVDQERGRTGQDRVDHLVQKVGGLHLEVVEPPVHDGPERVRGQLSGRHLLKLLEHPGEDVFAEAVHEDEGGFPPADLDLPDDHVKVGLHSEPPAQLFQVGLEGAGHLGRLPGHGPRP